MVPVVCSLLSLPPALRNIGGQKSLLEPLRVLCWRALPCNHLEWFPVWCVSFRAHFLCDERSKVSFCCWFYSCRRYEYPVALQRLLYYLILVAKVPPFGRIFEKVLNFFWGVGVYFWNFNLVFCNWTKKEGEILFVFAGLEMWLLCFPAWSLCRRLTMRPKIWKLEWVNFLLMQHKVSFFCLFGSYFLVSFPLS